MEKIVKFKIVPFYSSYVINYKIISDEPLWKRLIKFKWFNFWKEIEQVYYISVNSEPRYSAIKFNSSSHAKSWLYNYNTVESLTKYIKEVKDNYKRSYKEFEDYHKELNNRKTEYL